MKQKTVITIEENPTPDGSDVVIVGAAGEAGNKIQELLWLLGWEIPENGIRVSVVEA